jgi:hypothetical protein
VRMPSSFDYAVIRIVPAVEREEFFNAGVIVFCPEQRFLAARVYIDQEKLKAFAPELAPQEIQRRLEAIEKICAGDPSAGTIAQLAQRARFHWLVAPRSTLLQVSPTHSGICEEPRSTLDRLFDEQVSSASKFQRSA